MGALTGPAADAVAAAWAELHRMLEGDRYMRFSMHSHRDWDDASRRLWDAVLFMEGGRVLARARRSTRDGAAVAVLEEMRGNRQEQAADPARRPG